MTDAQENLVFPWAPFSSVPPLLPAAQRMTMTSEFQGEGYKKQAWKWEVSVPQNKFGVTLGKMLDQPKV